MIIEQSREEVRGHLSNRDRPISGGLEKKPISEWQANQNMHHPDGDHLASQQQKEVVKDPEAIDTLQEMFQTLERDTIGNIF